MSDATNPRAAAVEMPEANQENRPELEVTNSVERDAKGISYIMNLVAMYGLFFICMIVIAWFGIFSEV
jgi:hypothetical protein